MLNICISMCMYLRPEDGDTAHIEDIITGKMVHLIYGEMCYKYK